MSEVLFRCCSMIFLSVFDTFLDLRVMSYLSEEFPYIESLLDPLVLELVIE